MQGTPPRAALVLTQKGCMTTTTTISDRLPHSDKDDDEDDDTTLMGEPFDDDDDTLMGELWDILKCRLKETQTTDMQM